MGIDEDLLVGLAEGAARRRLHSSGRYNALIELVSREPGIPILAAAWRLWREGCFLDCENIEDVRVSIRNAVAKGAVLGVTMRRQGQIAVLWPVESPVRGHLRPLRAHDHPEIQATFPSEADYEVRLAEHLP